MTTSPEDPVLDVERILATLDRHHVDYLVVGGISTRLHGALRPTKDFDCLPERSRDNLARLGAAMRELNARLRVAALTDAEAQQLPTRIDATSLQQMQLSTWRTDAGDFDVLADMPDRHGRRVTYEDLAPRCITIGVGGLSIRVADLDDVIASKEWANRPKDHEALPELRAIRARQAQEHGAHCPPPDTGGLSPIAFPQPPTSAPPATGPGASPPPSGHEPPPRGRHR
jgi:hypothetical protein